MKPGASRRDVPVFVPNHPAPVHLSLFPSPLRSPAMSRDTYLSIDLDYWNKAPFEPALLDAVFARGERPHVTLDHHDLLPHADAHPELSHLVNIDYHSDLLSTHEPPHIGNWVNYVSWREHGHYLWILPRMNDYHLRWGYCHVGENPFMDTRRLTGWLSADKREGYEPDLLERVAAVGICISPNYLDNGSAAEAAIRHLLGHMTRSGTPLVTSRNPENNRRFEERLHALGIPHPPAQDG